tara:strand:- start:129 stop:380 length:252 start_codon:yes stop_codon:yes gene_type:complete
MKNLVKKPVHSKTPKIALIPKKGQRVPKAYLITGNEQAKIKEQTKEGLQILASHKPSGKLNKRRQPTKTIRCPRYKTKYPNFS